jgi:hypothetical protein
MAPLEGLRRDIMTAGADAAVGLLALAQLRRVGIVTGIAVASHRRGMADTVRPELIDVMTAKAQARLLFEQIAALCVPVGMVTDRTILVPPRRPGRWVAVLMAGDAEVLSIVSQQKRQDTAVRTVTQFALTIFEWLMRRLLAL